MWAPVADRLGQAPAVGVLQFHQHALGHPAERLARLPSRETAGDPGQQDLELLAVPLVRYGASDGRRVLMLSHISS